MAGFLGFSRTELAGVSAFAISAGVAIGFAIPAPELPECGWTVEEGVAIPASCSDAEELNRLMDGIRAQQIGERFATERLLDECAETNGATLTVEECFNYLAWLEFASVCEEFAGEESEECVEIRTQEWRERGN